MFEIGALTEPGGNDAALRMRAGGNSTPAPREERVLATLSAISVVLGAAVAQSADRFPARTELMETSAGALLIGGLMLMGAGLPAIL